MLLRHKLTLVWLDTYGSLGTWIGLANVPGTRGGLQQRTKSTTVIGGMLSTRPCGHTVASLCAYNHFCIPEQTAVTPCGESCGYPQGQHRVQAPT